VRDREYFERVEDKALASYAMRSKDSRGRRHEEAEHAFRPAFQRDRDRVIHSTAFRRLEYKTQVFVNHEGDYYRTRLTHTMECAQITRTVARALGLNQDLAEAIALAHDLGHTPFGHAGERILSDLMADHGGFEHNSQSLRIVEVLEERYPGFRGLNLSYEVCEGIVKHSTSYDRAEITSYNAEEAPLLEAQIVDYADEIAYNSHDIDDGLQSGMLTVEDLAGVRLWESGFETARQECPGAADAMLRYQAVRHIIDAMVSDFITTIDARIRSQGVDTVEDVRAIKPKLVCMSPEMEDMTRELKDRLMDRLYQHQRVRRMAGKAKRIMTGIFLAYIEDPRQMPPHVVAKDADGTPMARVIADYIAGMTDRFALEEYRKLFDPYERV